MPQAVGTFSTLPWSSRTAVVVSGLTLLVGFGAGVLWDVVAA